MTIVTCAERTSRTPNVQDAGWASNAAEDQLYYPYISSCVTVTLVFENGVLGGHASQVSADNKRQPEDNLIAVINRMIGAAPDQHTRGAFLKIYFIGTADDTGWNLSRAENVITANFGNPRAVKPVRHGHTPVDVVFDTKTKQLFSVSREKSNAQGAAQTLNDGEDMGVSYL